MSQRVQVLLVCDLHDGDEVEGTETVAFGLDGASYEIDVCDEHAEELRDSFAVFVGVARWPVAPARVRHAVAAGRPGWPPRVRRPRRTIAPARFASGPETTATPSTSAAGFRRLWWPPTTRLTEGAPQRRSLVRDPALRRGGGSRCPVTGAVPLTAHPPTGAARERRHASRG